MSLVDRQTDVRSYECSVANGDSIARVVIRKNNGSASVVCSGGDDGPIQHPKVQFIPATLRTARLKQPTLRPVKASHHRAYRKATSPSNSKSDEMVNGGGVSAHRELEVIDDARWMVRVRCGAEISHWELHVRKWSCLVFDKLMPVMSPASKLLAGRSDDEGSVVLCTGARQNER